MKKRTFLVVVTLLCLIFIPFKYVHADDGFASFNGLYLIDGEATLDRVSIEVSIDSPNSSSVKATYYISNNTEETVYLTMGTPITNLKMDNIRFRFEPYYYNSVIASGAKINPLIEEVDVDYSNWRNFNMPMTLKAGESSQATISFNIQNKQEYPGKVEFSFDMRHLKSWTDDPKNIEIDVGFNAKSIKPYNFDDDFNVKPTEISKQYGYSWRLSGKDAYKDISFNYYFVDNEIIRQLKQAKSSQVNKVIKSYEDKEYEKVIEYGNNFIQSTTDSTYQTLTYILMADAYIGLKEYNEALVVYDLIETGLESFGNMQQKIEEKILLGQIQCYNNLKEYEKMYGLIAYNLNFENLSIYMKEKLEEQLSLIPEDKLAKIEEDYREPTASEILLKRFLRGDFYLPVIIIFLIILLISFFLYIRRKRKKNRFFY